MEASTPTIAFLKSLASGLKHFAQAYHDDGDVHHFALVAIRERFLDVVIKGFPMAFGGNDFDTCKKYVYTSKSNFQCISLVKNLFHCLVGSVDSVGSVGSVASPLLINLYHIKNNIDILINGDEINLSNLQKLINKTINMLQCDAGLV